MERQAPDDLEGVADLRHRDPERARELAAAWVNSADPLTSATASWIIGLAEHELARPEAAMASFDAAAAIADRAGLDDQLARTRASAAISLLTLGRQTDAEQAMDEALARAGPAARGYVLFLQGLVHQRTGHLDEAAAAYDDARPELRRSHDHAALARLHLNRGTLRAYRGDVKGAVHDFGECERLAQALDLPVLVAMAAHNSGFALGRFGDVPAALEAFDRAGVAYEALGDPDRLVGVLAADRGEVLRFAGLTAEARDAADASLDRLRSAGDKPQIDEALLHAARAELASGRSDAARARAEEAEAGFRGSGRMAWAALAGYTAVQAEVAASEDQHRASPGLLHRAQAIARELEREGWPVEAAHARTLVARMALADGELVLARQVVAKTRPSARTSPALQIQAWHGLALLRLAEGRRREAGAAIRRGLQVVEAHREALGATELRANASALGADLARLGVRLALDQGRPAPVLVATEAHRAGALHLPSARPDADPRLADAIAALRAAEADQRAAVLEGRGDGTNATTVVAAERRVRDLSRLSHGAGATDHRRLTLAALRASLEDRVLVSFTALEDALHAVVVEPERTRLVALGAVTAVESERQHLISALRRGLHTSLRTPTAGRTDDAGASRVVAALDAACSRLDELLVAPLDLPPGADVVVVPTGSGHGLPWGSLPGLRGRAVTVAPSAALWARPRRPRRPSGPLVVAGPDLAGAEPEVEAIAATWPAARTLTGSGATVAAVLEAFGSTDLVHVAAHGTFRADSPLFSSLRLSDASLTVYDLERLDRAPATVVLPACSAGAVDVRAGDELLGTTAALLGIGVVSVIAPVVPVPDLATARYSIELHRHLAAGVPPARAAAAASERLRADGDATSALVATSFVCFGADDRPGVERRDTARPPAPAGVSGRRSTDHPRGGDRA